MRLALVFSRRKLFSFIFAKALQQCVFRGGNEEAEREGPTIRTRARELVMHESFPLSRFHPFNTDRSIDCWNKTFNYNYCAHGKHVLVYIFDRIFLEDLIVDQQCLASRPVPF